MSVLAVDRQNQKRRAAAAGVWRDAMEEFARVRVKVVKARRTLRASLAETTPPLEADAALMQATGPLGPESPLGPEGLQKPTRAEVQPTVPFQAAQLPPISAAAAAALPEGTRKRLFEWLSRRWSAAVPVAMVDHYQTLRTYVALTRASPQMIELEVKESTITSIRNAAYRTVKQGGKILLVYALPVLTVTASVVYVAAQWKLDYALQLKMIINISVSAITVGKALYDPKKSKMRALREGLAELVKTGAALGLPFVTATLLGTLGGPLGVYGVVVMTMVVQVGSGAIVNMVVNKVLLYDNAKFQDLQADLIAQKEKARLAWLEKYYEPLMPKAVGQGLQLLRDFQKLSHELVTEPGMMSGWVSVLIMGAYYGYSPWIPETLGLASVPVLGAIPGVSLLPGLPVDTLVNALFFHAAVVAIANKLAGFVFAQTIQPFLSSWYKNQSAEVRARIDALLQNQVAIACATFVWQLVQTGATLKFIEAASLKELRRLSLERVVPGAAVDIPEVAKLPYDPKVFSLYPETVQGKITQAIKYGMDPQGLKREFAEPLVKFNAEVDARVAEWEQTAAAALRPLEQQLRTLKSQSDMRVARFNTLAVPLGSAGIDANALLAAQTKSQPARLLDVPLESISDEVVSKNAGLFKLMMGADKLPTSAAQVRQVWEDHAAKYEDRANAVAEIRERLDKETGTIRQQAADYHAKVLERLETVLDKYIAAGKQGEGFAQYVNTEQAGDVFKAAAAVGQPTQPILPPPPNLAPVSTDAGLFDRAGALAAAPVPESATPLAQASAANHRQSEQIEQMLMQTGKVRHETATKVAEAVMRQETLTSLAQGQTQAQTQTQMQALLNTINQLLTRPGSVDPATMDAQLGKLANGVLNGLSLPDFVQYARPDVNIKCVSRVGALKIRENLLMGTTEVVDDAGTVMDATCLLPAVAPGLIKFGFKAVEGLAATAGGVFSFGTVSLVSKSAVVATELLYGAALNGAEAYAAKVLPEDKLDPARAAHDFMVQLMCLLLAGGYTKHPKCRKAGAYIDTVDLAAKTATEAGGIVLTAMERLKGTMESISDQGVLGTVLSLPELVSNVKATLKILISSPEIATTVLFGSEGISTLYDAGKNLLQVAQTKPGQLGYYLLMWIPTAASYSSASENANGVASGIQNSLSFFGQLADLFFPKPESLTATLAAGLTEAERPQYTDFLAAVQADPVAQAILDAKAATGWTSWVYQNKELYTVILPDNATFQRHMADARNGGVMAFYKKGNIPDEIIVGLKAAGGLDWQSALRSSMGAIVPTRAKAAAV